MEAPRALVGVESAQSADDGEGYDDDGEDPMYIEGPRSPVSSVVVPVRLVLATRFT